MIPFCLCVCTAYSAEPTLIEGRMSVEAKNYDRPSLNTVRYNKVSCSASSFTQKHEESGLKKEERTKKE